MNNNSLKGVHPSVSAMVLLPKAGLLQTPPQLENMPKVASAERSRGGRKKGLLGPKCKDQFLSPCRSFGEKPPRHLESSTRTPPPSASFHPNLGGVQVSQAPVLWGFSF